MSQAVAERDEKQAKIFNRQAQKVVADAYRRWSLITRGSNCKVLTGKILVLWIGGRLWEVVAYEEVAAHGGSTIFTNSNST